jgi:ATP-dependent Lon protease
MAHRDTDFSTFPTMSTEVMSPEEHEREVQRLDKSESRQNFVESIKPDLPALKLQEAALRMELADSEIPTLEQTPSRGVVSKILSPFIRKSSESTPSTSSKAEIQEKLQQNILEQKILSDILVMIHDHSVGELLDAQQVLQESPQSVETAKYPELPHFFLAYSEALNKNLPDKTSSEGKVLRTKAREMLAALLNNEIAKRLQDHLAPVIKAIDTAQTESELKAKVRDKYPFFASHYERALRENADPISADSRLTEEQRAAANQKMVETMLAREIFPSPFNQPDAATERQALPVAQLLFKRIEAKRQELSAKRAA